MDEVCGGWSETTDIEEIQQICDEVKGEVEKNTNMKYDEFRAVKYRTQVVAGRNYLIKVHVRGENYIHLFVFQALPCHGRGLQVLGVQPHKRDDPLEPFRS